MTSAFDNKESKKDFHKESDSIEVRFADYHKSSDGRAIIGLLDHYARQPEGGLKPLSSYTSSQLINKLQVIDGAVSVLAFDSGKPVGLVNCFTSFSTFKCKPVLNIHDVVVREGYRRRGIAKRMLATVETFAKEEAYCKITLEVLNKNTAAKNLYKELGFDPYELIPKMGHALFWEKVL